MIRSNAPCQSLDLIDTGRCCAYDETMTNEQRYRHPKHDAIVALLRAGCTDLYIAAELHVDRRAAARVRGILGIEPRRNGTTTGDKLDKFSSEPDAEGHVRWSGRTSRSGTPLIRHRGREIPAAAVAFERRTGRAPVGVTRADCDVPHCLAPHHVADDVERRLARMNLRATYGLNPRPWVTCPEGHEWDTAGRIEPDLTPYCQACNTDRVRRTRAARIEENGS